MKSLNIFFDLLLTPFVFLIHFILLPLIRTTKSFLFIALLVGTPMLHANTCPPGEVITIADSPISGSVQNGGEEWYYYSITPGVAGDLTLSNYSSDLSTDVDFTITTCTGNQIVKNSTVITEPTTTLTVSATQTVYIAIEERTNQGNTINYSFDLSFIPVPTSTPTVTDATFSINEDLNNGDIVGTVSTTDGAPASFTIVSGNTGSVFQISNTGVISILDNTNLDYETTTSYSLIVRADNVVGQGTEGTVVIDVLDIEEDPPVVADASFSISETASNTTTVGTVSITGGTPTSVIIVSGNTDGIFQISNTGVITVLDNSNLDFATTSSYSLVIQASNSIGSDTGTTSITITQSSADLTSSNPRNFVKVNADTNLFGDLIMIGNQSLCDTSDGLTCANPPSNATNNSVSQNNVHKDGSALAAGYANSTSSDLVLGPNDVVVEAWLYWIGRIDDSSTTTRATAKTVQLKVPGQTSYTAITSLASKFNWMVDGSIFDYGGGANITSFVQAAGGGTYWVADLQATEMTNQGSGWAIAVIVRDTTTNTRTMKNISLYDGFQGVFDGSGYPDSITSTISGFRTPNSGTIDSNLIIFAGESDRGLNDSVSITNSTGAVLLRDSLNDTSNVLNATISRNGANVTDRNPNHENTLGVDIDEIDTSSIMDYAQTSTDITVTSNGDRIFLAMYGFATELYIPQLCYDYAYKQYDRYFTEDNNGSILPSIIGSALSTIEPITVELFFQNIENSDILFSNITVDITDINTSQAIYVPNSTYVINPGEVFPRQYNTLTGIPINDIDSKDYFFLDYDLDLLTSDINMPLNADIHYEIVFSDGSGVTSTIPYTTNILSMSLCSALNFVYVPIPATFNVEDAVLADSQLYNLPTQTANRAGNFKVAVYDPENTDTRMEISTIVALELIDAGKYHGIDASCIEPDSALTPRVWVTFGNAVDGNVSLTDFNADTIQYAIDNGLFSDYIATGVNSITSPGKFYENVRENTAFRLSYNDVGAGNGVVNLTPIPCNNPNQDVAPCFEVLNFPDLSGIDIGAGDGNCAQDIDNNPTNQDKIPQVCGNAGNSGMDSAQLAICMECIYGYNMNLACSRDNFATRPESFRMSLKDQDQNDVTQQSDIGTNNDITLVHDNNNVNNTGYQVAAGYNYYLEVNATNHENETATPGYDVSFLLDGDEGTRTFKLKWHDIADNTPCNDIEDQNKSLTFLNGQIDLNVSSDQVGKYDLNLFDKLWTKVDWDPTAMTHHTGNYFLTGLDCAENTSYVPALNTTTVISGQDLTDISGCDINSSNHVNSDTAAEYSDLPLRVHPYTFDQSAVIPAAGPYSRTNGQTFIYINTPDADDQNMSYNMNGIFRAAGLDTSVILNNFVDQCYGDDVNMTLHLQYQHALTTDSEPYLTYDLVDINTSDGSILVPRPTAVVGEPTYRFSPESTGPLSITQLEQYFVKDLNGSIDMDLGYNFPRTYNEEMNPRFIQMDDFNITYLNNPANIKANLKSSYIIFGNKTLDQNVSFFYGRAKPGKFFYEDVNNTSIFTPVSIVAYCDLGFTTCQDRGIQSVFAKTNQENWWFSLDHNSNDGDGDVVLVVGAVTEGSGTPVVNPASPNPISITSNAIDNTISVSSGPTPTLPLTVEIDFDTDPTLARFTDDWVIYNEYENIIPTDHPFYKVRFIGDANWTGIGKEGMVVGTSASKRKTKRLDW